MGALTRIETSIKSHYLQRPVRLSLILPPWYHERKDTFPVLYLNDGQDLTRLHMEKVLETLYHQQAIDPFILVAMHANQNRLHEYGTAARSDYAGRGSKAGLHTDFVLKELQPYILDHFRGREHPTDNFYAGFSLGGLSAMDIVWHHPDRFSRAGIFSGALWWRRKALHQGYDEATDRIMHLLVREGSFSPGLKFWFQAGTEDETNDRNNNGIIDAIDDTLDLITELEQKGYQREQDIVYYEMPGGRHDQETWSRAMPVFLKWLIGR